jgi:hypothetical protein
MPAAPGNRFVGFSFGRQRGADMTCNLCDGTGRIARDTADIIGDAVADAARFHWKTSIEKEDTCNVSS